MNLWAELRRRRVVRVAAVYAVTAWLLIQIVTSIEEPLSLPTWLDTFVIVVLAIGFPVALILSWAYDVTPQGLQPTPAREAEQRAPVSSAQWLTHAGQVLILLAVAFLVADQYLLDGTRSAAATDSTRPSIGARATQRVSIMLPPEHTIAFGWGNGHSLAISPDGRTVAFASSPWDDMGRVHHLAVRELGSREVREVPGSANGGLQPFFSPDGRWVAFFTADGLLKKASLAGGAAIEIADNILGSTWSTGVWTNSDEIVFAPSVSDRLYRVNTNGGAVEAIAASVNLNGARWSRPDYVQPANAIIASNISPATGTRHIEAIFLDSNTRKVVAEDADAARYVGSGHLVLQRENVLLLAAIDPETLELSGSPVPLADTARMDGLTGEGQFAQFDVADNGDLLYVPFEESLSQLYVVDRKGNAQALAFPTDMYSTVAVSPSWRTLAVTIDGGTRRQVMLLDLERGTRARLPSETASEMTPVWRPDGAAIVTASRASEGWAVIEHELNGESRLLASLNGTAGVYRNFSWHPNGRDLLFTWQSGLEHDIMVLTLGGEDADPRPLVAKALAEHTPSVSPDGKWLAYIAGASVGEEQLYIRRYPDGIDVPVSREFAQGPVWSPDSSELYFQGNYGAELMMLAVAVTDAGVPMPELSDIEPLFALRTRVGSTRVDAYQLSANSGPTYGVLADGRFVIPRTRDQARLQELVLVQNLEWPTPP